MLRCQRPRFRAVLQLDGRLIDILVRVGMNVSMFPTWKAFDGHYRAKHVRHQERLGNKNWKTVENQSKPTG